MVERATRRVLRIAVSRAAALLAMLPVLLALPTGAMADRERHIRARITPPSKAVLREILTSHLDILHAHGVRLDVRVSEAELSTLRGMGCSVEIVDQDVYESALRGGGFLPQYISYSEAVARLNAYAATYPAIAQVTDIGNSVQNRDIFALKISDNVGVDENEPEVLYVGNHHAREVITPILTLAIADSLLTNYGDDPQFTQWVDEREIWVVPTINPDGLVWVELNDLWWRKNRRTNGGGSIGVDLNRNYAFQWGHDNIGSSPFGSDETFRGSGPASEPEIQAVVGLRELAPVRVQPLLSQLRELVAVGEQLEAVVHGRSRHLRGIRSPGRVAERLRAGESRDGHDLPHERQLRRLALWCARASQDLRNDARSRG